MDFSYSSKVQTLCTQLQSFMDAHVIPRHRQWVAEAQAGNIRSASWPS